MAPTSVKPASLLLDLLATALLAVGCLSGLVGLLLRNQGSLPYGTSPIERKKRAPELLKPIADQLPKVVERQERDH